MEVGFGIKIAKNSEEYLNIPKKYKYKKVDELKPSSWVIIHMYPKEDTLDEKGNLNGFCDALFFDAHIYDAVNMEYIIVKYKDGIDFDVDVKPSRIYIYKDGSSCIVFKVKDKLKVMLSKSLTVYKSNN